MTGLGFPVGTPVGSFDTRSLIHTYTYVYVCIHIYISIHTYTYVYVYIRREF